MPEELEKRIKALEEWKAQRQSRQLEMPIDLESQVIIRAAAQNNLLNENWRDYFYYHTFFESIDGYAHDNLAGTATVDVASVNLSTGNTSGNESDFAKTPNYQQILRWDREQRFRIGIQLSSVADVEARIGIGNIVPPGLGSMGTHLGFRVSNATLQGTSRLGSNETQVTLATISAGGVGVEVEYRYLPGEKVIFLVNGAESGVIETNLPSGSANPLNQAFLHAWIKTNANANKILRFSSMEYMQKR